VVFESPLLAAQLDIAWHGGEPLVVPITWYKRATELIEQNRPTKLQLKHRFQTNGLLLDKEWVRFFAQLSAAVGLSIDGPAEYHNANRLTRNGHGTHEAAMRAVRLLRDENLAFHVITVLTERLLDQPEKLFEFYIESGIKEVGFNIEEIEGLHRSSSLANPGVERKFRSFVKRFFDLAWEAHELIKVRELESTLGTLLLNEPVENQQNLSFAIVSISSDGGISTFSPELLGAQHPRFDNKFIFGNVASHNLSDLSHMPLFKAIEDEIRSGVAACERSCRYFRWCGGGAPANKLFEDGRFDATETLHCRLTLQAVFDEVVDGIESRLEKARNTGSGAGFLVEM
jgi:uncharacterized protein